MVAGPGVGALCWVFAAERGLSLFVESGDCSPVSVGGLLMAVASLVAERGLWSAWAQHCGTQA